MEVVIMREVFWENVNRFRNYYMLLVSELSVLFREEGFGMNLLSMLMKVLMMKKIVNSMKNFIII